MTVKLSFIFSWFSLAFILIPLSGCGRDAYQVSIPKNKAKMEQLTPVPANDSDLLPQEVESARIAAKTINFFDSQESAQIWPNFKFSTAATVVHFHRKPILAFDFQPKESFWQSYTELDRPALITQNDPYGISSIKIHPSFPIEGQSSYVFELFGKEAAGNFIYVAFVHERFHRYQFETFKFHLSDQNPSYPEAKHLENLQYIALENQIYLDVIKNPTVDDLKNIVAVSSERQKFLSTPSIAWEKLQLRLEGMAEYVGMKTFTVFPILGASFIEEKIRSRAESELGLDNLVDNSMKWRFYTVGNILGTLLDAAGLENWKERVADGASPLELAQEVAALNPVEQAIRLGLLKKRYGFQALAQRVKDEIIEYESKIKEIIRQYVELPGIEVTLHLPAGMKCSSGAMGDRTYYLQDGTTISLNLTSTVSCIVPGAILNGSFKNIPFIFRDGTESRFKLGVDTKIMVDDVERGLQDILSSGQKLKFQKLRINTETFSFESDASGEISTSISGISIKTL